MFSFPLYMTKGLKVINGRGREERLLKERDRAKLTAHISKASLVV